MDYYTPTGKPMKLMEWAEMYENFRDPTHLVTKVGPLVVSTTWLGLDHSFQQYLPWIQDPKLILIFETMVFAPKISGYSDLYMDRYSTIEQAVAGHWATVRMVRHRWPLLLGQALRDRFGRWK